MLVLLHLPVSPCHLKGRLAPALTAFPFLPRNKLINISLHYSWAMPVSGCI